MAKLITNSRLRAFRSCEQLHQFRYEQCIVPVHESSAARFGNLFHAGMEAWWTQQVIVAKPNGDTDILRFDNKLDAALYGIRVLAGSNANPFELARVDVLTRAYNARWLDAPYETIAAEVEFDMPLRNPETGRTSVSYRLAGKIDVLLRDLTDGRKYLLEHKTTNLDVSEGSEYWRRLRIDGQISMYYDGAAALGHEVSGCIYDVVVRPAHDQLLATPAEKREYTQGKKCKFCVKDPGKIVDATSGEVRACSLCNGTTWKEAPRLYAAQRAADETVDEFIKRLTDVVCENPNKFLSRGMVVRLEQEMDAHRYDIWYTTKHLHEVRKSGRHVRNPDSCVQFGRTCQYFDVCTGTASIDDETLFRHKGAVHSELKNGG